jgi:hypothetical protein
VSFVENFNHQIPEQLLAYQKNDVLFLPKDIFSVKLSSVVVEPPGKGQSGPNTSGDGRWRTANQATIRAFHEIC